MGGVERCGTLRLSARVLRARVWTAFTASQRISSGWWGRVGGEREGWRVRREGACPGERTEVVKMMCADVGLRPEQLTARRLLH